MRGEVWLTFVNTYVYNMKIFLAYPFTELINIESGLVNKNEKEFLMNCIKILGDNKYCVFSAHNREAYGENLMNADTATSLDYKEMCNTDLVVAFPEKSGGVHVELGWAASNNKPIILFINKEFDYSPMIQGLHKITKIKYVTYDRKKMENVPNIMLDEIKQFERGLLT
ncbi:hypothetical protein [Anaerocolumna chitinilytica]|uniref:Nucleoside 2-deoxyribosyltransferase n=1 Tax=Anaerocolumna chitinilytica TaxID=1727145 RepID=A0A7M3SA73_9FIRM|nr:hypothetical protein [Anaerocolumna chitinilytica]BCK01491.1 hypothetical protein bsdcttw_45310 [Anaerocolumna chitinilytica]